MLTPSSSQMMSLPKPAWDIGQSKEEDLKKGRDVVIATANGAGALIIHNSWSCDLVMAAGDIIPRICMEPDQA